MIDMTDFREQAVDLTLAVACNSCDWTGKIADVYPIHDLGDRVAPDEIVPAGECPKCHALASLTEFSVMFTLKDQLKRDRSLPVKVKFQSGGSIELRGPGYGNFNMPPGHAGPLYIELADDSLRAVIWSNINEEDPTHVIDLEGARESNRKAG